MKRISKFVLFLILAVLFYSGCNENGGGDPISSIDKEKTAAEASSLRVATLKDIDTDLITAVTIEDSDETLFLSGDKDKDGNPLAIDTIGFIPENVKSQYQGKDIVDDYLSPMCKLEIHDNGMPYKLFTNEAHYLEYTGYTNNSVTIKLFTYYGEQVGESKNIPVSKNELERLKSVFSSAFSNIVTQDEDKKPYKMILANLNSAIEFSGLAFNLAGSIAKTAASYDLWKGELTGNGLNDSSQILSDSTFNSLDSSKELMNAETIARKAIYWIEKLSVSELLPAAAKLTDNQNMDLISVSFDEMSCKTSSLSTEYCISDLASLAERALSETPSVTISSSLGTENWSLPYSTGKKIKFYGTASTIYDEIEAFSWDFGDGSFGTGKTVEHIYASGGSYAVTLKVLYADGIEASDTVNIYVNNNLEYIKEAIMKSTSLSSSEKEALLKALGL